MGIAAEIITAMIGAVAYSILFNVHGKKLILIFLGGGLCWSIYSLVLHYGGAVMLGYFISTLVIALLSEILARIVVKAPVISLLVPMLIPLIPGGSLYYTMQNLFSTNQKMALVYAQDVGQKSIAIACGILVGATIVELIGRTRRWIKRNH